MIYIEWLSISYEHAQLDWLCTSFFYIQEEASNSWLQMSLISLLLQWFILIYFDKSIISYDSTCFSIYTSLPRCFEAKQLVFLLRVYIFWKYQQMILIFKQKERRHKVETNPNQFLHQLLIYIHFLLHVPVKEMFIVVLNNTYLYVSYLFIRHISTWKNHSKACIMYVSGCYYIHLKKTKH